MTINYTYSNLKEFISYVPGDHHGNLMKVLAYLDPDGNPSFKNWTDTNFYQVHGQSQCCCEHDIIYEFRIAHKTTGDTMSIGSSCIKLFSNKMYLHTEKLKRMADRLGYLSTTVFRILGPSQPSRAQKWLTKPSIITHNASP